MNRLIQVTRPTQWDDGRQLGSGMKTIQLIAVLGVFVAASSTAISVRATDSDGVAVAIIYDTSGSMRDSVRDGTGKMSPKYIIANRALESIASRIQTFATNTVTGEPRNIQAGLFVFDGTDAKTAVKFGPFDARAFHDWAQNFKHPDGTTPLGNALKAAGRTVLNSGLTRKHVLVITDGQNTSGPTPATVMPQLKRLAEEKQTGLSVHFVAFDVNAGDFGDVKKLGATVVGAADETQLNQQLEFILEKKILLEEEEPPKKK
jgi:hypothetical protein